MAVSAASIKAFAPFFASVSDSVINQWIAYAETALAAVVFGANRDQAITYWVCHYLTKTGGDGSTAGAAGPETGRHVGDVGQTFAANDSASGGTLDVASLKTSIYGQLLIQLMRRYAGALCV